MYKVLQLAWCYVSLKRINTLETNIIFITPAKHEIKSLNSENFSTNLNENTRKQLPVYLAFIIYTASIFLWRFLLSCLNNDTAACVI